MSISHRVEMFIRIGAYFFGVSLFLWSVFLVRFMFFQDEGVFDFLVSWKIAFAPIFLVASLTVMEWLYNFVIRSLNRMSKARD